MKPICLAAVVLAAAVTLSACGSSAAPKTHHASLPRAMSVLQECQLLRRDIVANGGTPDRPTLSRIVDQPVANVAGRAERLSQDAYNARKDMGDTMLMGFHLAQFSFDCRPAGVQIPVP